MMQPILKIDLSTREIVRLSVPEDWAQSYLGGASLAARFLYPFLTPDLDPLSPGAPLLFLNGPLSGTSGPAVGRFVVCARSPATGLWGESNCGGFWGAELRFSGFDGLWLSGRAAEPVYLYIHSGEVEIRSAAHLWGLDTYSAQAAIAHELGVPRLRIAVIGPAGEALIPFAAILADHGRMAGRTGMGAVMGSKNLKAIAVHGDGQPPIADPQAYSLLRSQANRELRANAVTRVLHELGSAGAAEYFDYLGEMPKRYFHAEAYPQPLQIAGSNVAETLLVGTSACHACVIACGRVVRLEDGLRRKGPEYETLVGFGPNLWLNDPVIATRLGELCDRYGLDSISMSNTLALAFRLSELGVLPQTAADGHVLRWGDVQAIERLIHQTVQRRGLGELLAGGALHLARSLGVEEEAVQVNGLEVPYHDPRGASGMALVYATSPRGACHNQSDYFMVDIGQADPALGLDFFPRQAGAEKAANVARHQDWRTLCNALVLCFFADVPAESIPPLVNAVCGYDLDLPALLASGERAWNLKRLINYRLGLRRQNDRLPKALLQPYPPGEERTQGYVPDLDAMLAAYYQARGWDALTGMPTPEKLAALGLDWAAADIYSKSKSGGPA